MFKFQRTTESGEVFKLKIISHQELEKYKDQRANSWERNEKGKKHHPTSEGDKVEFYSTR